MRTINKILLSTIFSLPCLTVTSLAHAYAQLSCFNANGQRLGSQHVPANQFGQAVIRMHIPLTWGNTNPYTRALIESVAVINKSPANIGIDLRYDDGSRSAGNGRSEIYFSDDASHNPAITLPYINFSKNCELVETDIVYWSGQPWTPYRNFNDLWQYGGSSRGFHNITLHEFGHAFGVAHENRYYNIMGSDFSHSHRQGNDIVPYLGVDTTSALRQIYGNKLPLVQDVSLAEWEYSGTNGEYSTHIRSRITDTLGRVLPSDNGRTSSSISPEPIYHVSRGQKIILYLNTENSGASSHSNVPIQYFISTNGGNINLDRRLHNLPVGSLFLSTATLTIPNNLVANDLYWLGATIDPDNVINESDEMNNAWIRIKVVN